MMSHRGSQWWNTSVVRFLVVGGTNTLVTGAIVALLSFVLPGWVAFTVAFGLGLVFSVWATGRWVFQVEGGLRRSITFALAYIGIYLCGLGVVQLIVASGAPPWANGASVLVTAPLGFIAGRFIYKSDTVDTVDKGAS